MLPDELEQWTFYASLGPEPLDTSAERLADRIAGRKARIKGLLLDQTVVAGCGNIYADESLFRAGIHPMARACDIEQTKLVALFRHLQDVLAQAIAENGSSIRNYVNADGDAGAFQNSFNVYGRKGECCPRCGCCLACGKVAGRTSTFCPQCQSK
jgi:formamidopyrimidine-DNA glycosylase